MIFHQRVVVFQCLQPHASLDNDAGKKQGEVDLLPLTHLFRKQFG
jgi:hypothetical protein